MSHLRRRARASLAALIGMSPESVRARARRKGWRRTIGNDGKALILVPPDTARIPAAPREDGPPASHPASPPASRPVPGRDTTASELLTRLAATQAELVETTERLGLAEGQLVKAEAALRAAGQERDAANERARLAEAGAATVPALRETAEALKTALASLWDQTARDPSRARSPADPRAFARATAWLAAADRLRPIWRCD
jgi:hypothetical protein